MKLTPVVRNRTDFAVNYLVCKSESVQSVEDKETLSTWFPWDCADAYRYNMLESEVWIEPNFVGTTETANDCKQKRELSTPNIPQDRVIVVIDSESSEEAGALQLDTTKHETEVCGYFLRHAS